MAPVVPKPQTQASATSETVQAEYTNSREFFDDQFRIGEWERNNGPAQTRYFMSRLIAELPAVECAYLNNNALSILDWGCAFGDGLDLLKRAFPKCSVAGLDFSFEAISRARRMYPHHEFILSDRIERDFDVIIVSNCLEHFGDPLQVVEAHLASCRKLYIALVPYQESPLYDGHLSRFGIETFPRQLGSWTCIGARRVKMEPEFWNGQQLLIVYGSMFYLQEVAADSNLFEVEISAEREMSFDEEDAAYRERLAAESKKWGAHLKVEAAGEWNAWLDHPAIANHYRKRALVEGLSWPQWVRKQLGGPAEKCLDLGCGAGGRSFAVHSEGAATYIEGLDISEDRVAEAERIRRERGIPGAFRVADSNTSEILAGRYELIFSCHSFHHFLRLEHIMEQVHKALLPSGLFVLEEYVGPTQFQWTEEQITLVRSLMPLVPERLRRFRWDAIKTHEGRPTPAEVVAASPFESIRSADIYALFQKYFQIVAIRKLGGTIQHLLYNGIMHNFQPSDPDAMSCMQAILSIEDVLVDNDLLPSDFMLLIGRRKDAARSKN